MNLSIKESLKQRALLVENWLRNSITDPHTPSGLKTAMMYSLLAGGKRIRPVLCLAGAELFKAQQEQIMPFACAFEFIHTYSLIHDDLPAMDDDDLRRGRPSNHKQFDEATAILAGDALLTDAFAYMASVSDIPAPRVLQAIAYAARSAGSSGMVGGQYLDMFYTNQVAPSLEQMAAMHAMKTGALLTAPVVCGAILSGASTDEIQAIEAYGQAVGAAFQIVDDILDETGTEEELGKPVGSDKEMRKTTYPSLLGLTKSKELAEEKAAQAQAALTKLKEKDSSFLSELARYIVVRVS